MSRAGMGGDTERWGKRRCWLTRVVVSLRAMLVVGRICSLVRHLGSIGPQRSAFRVGMSAFHGPCPGVVRCVGRHEPCIPHLHTEVCILVRPRCSMTAACVLALMSACWPTSSPRIGPHANLDGGVSDTAVSCTEERPTSAPATSTTSPRTLREGEQVGTPPPRTLREGEEQVGATPLRKRPATATPSTTFHRPPSRSTTPPPQVP
jgi:hypothetical protein